jgi:hypothetical protein
MTVIPLIVPLEDEDAEKLHRLGHTVGAMATASVGDESQGSRQHEETVADTNHSQIGTSSTVLSQELREQFETMKEVWRQAKRASSNAESDHENDPPPQMDDAQESSESHLVRQNLKRKERETAVETALAVDAEIASWRNGIAELEAMLAAEEEFDSNPSNGDELFQPVYEQGQENASSRRPLLLPPLQQDNAHLQFPLLPPIVPDDDDYSSDCA